MNLSLTRGRASLVLRIRLLEIADDEEQRGEPGAASAGLRPAALSFEVNRGQTDSRVDFLARGDGYGLFLTRGDAVLKLGGEPAGGCG
jgi:hypothetical protein